MAQPSSDTEYEQLGSGAKLTLVDAVAQSVGFMGPVFSIAFLVPLLVGIIAVSGKGAGTAAPLSVVIASIGVLGLGWIVAEYAKRIQSAGALYDYVSDGLGSRIGAASGLVYYVGIIGLGAGLVTLLGGTIYDTVAGEFDKTPIPRTAWMLLIIAVLGVVLYLGVALSTRAQLVLALFSISVVLLFFLYVIVKVGSGNNISKAFNPSSSPSGLSGVLFGVLYGVLLFTGFETSANLGEETEHPKRDIPRAVLFSVLAIAGFYLIGTYAQVAGYGFDLDKLGTNAGAPLFGLAGPVADGGFGSVSIRRLLEFVVVLDMLAVAIGITVASSRGLFAMARDRRLPKGLAKVSSRGTPLVAGGIVLGIFVVVVILTKTWIGLFALTGVPHYAAMFTWMSTLGSCALGSIYLLLSVGAVKGLKSHPQQWKVYLAVVVSVLVTGGAVFGAVYKQTAPTIWAPWVALAIFVVGLVLTFVYPGRASASTQFTGLIESETGPVKL